MLASMVACSGKEDVDDSTGVADTMVDQEGIAENERLDIDYSTLDYGGMEINILQREHLTGEMEGVASNGKESIVNQETKNRNAWLEANLGVKLVFQSIKGTPSDITEYNTTIRKAVMADTGEYDISSGYAYFFPQIAKEGYMANLLEMPNISTEKLWWNQSYNSVNTLNGKLYSVIGDITHSMIDETEVVFFNTQMINNFFGDDKDLYKIALEGNWTLEELETCVKQIGANDDFASLLVGYNSSAIDGLLMGTGVSICKKNNDGKFEMNMANDKNYTMVERLKTLVHDEGNGVFTTGSKNGTNHKYNYEDSFAVGDGAFFIFRMYHARDVLAPSGMKYGILPMPKADTQQDNYQCTPHDEYSCLSVFNNVSMDKRDAIGALLEVMGWYSHENLRPVIYETLYGTRYLSDSQSAEMFEVIVDTTTFDFGFVWSNVLADPVHIFRNYIWNDESGLASKVESLNSDILMAELMFQFYGN